MKDVLRERLLINRVLMRASLGLFCKEGILGPKNANREGSVVVIRVNPVRNGTSLPGVVARKWRKVG